MKQAELVVTTRIDKAKDSPELKNVLYLDIGQMNITAEGIDVIANNISSAKLMSLNLGYKNLRNEGVIKLLHALMANQYIKELILNETRISEKSAEVIENF
ncbi:hypothetical protein [Rickettsia rickettsii]|uniref:Uncharacterized protein n=1 Tax=Rickettsia rickettsii (strain Sheila Smith) TaxID=392021 RepID=A0A0H3AXF0_RICRS|nr:hypothetical protein [Rickettsia rickettsii]ABV76437.1 hypothetical protein A1G_04685 [Rickettsia rickettsii str. 'Sheila Smith']AFB21992.1 hypothetical protein RPN_02300 [Rickettsia rickettsii str. Brazil]AJG33778.1 hypothetical protein RRR_04405 [Rickettsia rickettsii str. R]USD86311.1 hypothetical protein NDY48_04390 [Rickettsia rickettsii]USD87625.1 hypothetical protein NDY49_04430 [Rickettsia rickettsii]